MNKKGLLAFSKFSSVGVLNTIMDLVVYMLLTSFGMYYLVAQCLSYGTGVANSYMLNRKWTFQRKEPSTAKEVIKFLAVNLVTFICSSLILLLCHEYASFNLFVSKGAASIGSLGISFLLTNRYVFTKTMEGREHYER
ncbi:GtrA family protein [Priestia flexa]|uniref:GtrA family protein n=1 Tax=Priestia flexa TaxID=86664 RepID=UPI001B333B60